jgi:hypothetical protein
MNTIKIVRLKNGEDIIGDVTANGIQYYDIEEPMAFEVDYRGDHSGLVMRHWLPVQLLKKNHIQLNVHDVLCVLEPDEEFSEYYVNTVEKIKRLLEAKNSIKDMSDEEINQIVDEYNMINQGNDTLH